MPKIPTFDAQAPASGQVRVRQISGADFGGQIGDALSIGGQQLSQTARALKQKEERDALYHVEKTVAESRSRWAKRMVEFEDNAPPGAENYTKSFNEEYDTWKYETLDTAKTPNARKALDADLERMRASLLGRVTSFEVTERARYNTEQVKQAVDDGINSVMTDPNLLPEVLTQQERIIKSMPGLNARQRDQMLEETRQRTEMAAVHGEMQVAELAGDYDESVSILSRLQDGGIKKRLSSENYNKLFNEAISTSERTLQQEMALMRRAEQRQAKQEKQTKDDTMIEGLTLGAKGDLTTEWVVNNSQKLSPEHYKYLLKYTTGQIDMKSDPSVYAPLRLQASQGIDVRGSAMDAVTHQQITLGDFNNIVSAIESRSVAGQAPTWLEAGDDFVNHALKPSDVNPNIALQQLYAKAIDQWHQWARNNPNASWDEARKEYKAITEQAKSIDIQTVLQELKPRFLVGTRNNPDLDATVLETKKAYESGDIRKSAYIEELRNIKRWKEALANEPTGNK